MSASASPVPSSGRKPAHRALELPHWRLLTGETLLAASVGVLSLIVKLHPGPVPADLGTELAVQHALLPHHVITAAIEAVSTLFFPTPALITLAAILIAFGFLRRWLDMIVCAAALGISDGSGLLLSHLVGRPRPSDHSLHIVSHLTSTTSFPSGHVTYVVTIFGLLLFLTYQVRHPIHPAIMWPIRVIVASVIVTMPISRILEGEHWPSDVLGGILYGSFWLLLITHAYLWARRRWPVLLAPDER